MNSRVVLESRHKFIYYDYESKEFFPELSNEHTSKLNNDEPIVLYVLNEGLPKVNTKLKLNNDIIKSFHARYYELLIFLAIIDNIAKNMDHRLLNHRLKDVFRLLSHVSNEEEGIKDIKTLRTLLIESKNIYKEEYENYLETGNHDFYNKVPIPFVMMDLVVPMIRECLGFRKHFVCMIDFEETPSVYTCMAVNDYIASRCNGYLSMNVLLHRDCNWESYYSNNGQFIEYTHDYTEVHFRKYKSRGRSIQE